jgi:CheY-like chemotaxis protein
MQSRSHSPKLPEFMGGKTRYRNPHLSSAVSADPVRILIIAKFHECVGIAALVHSIGRFATRMACSAESALKLAGEFLPDVVLLTTDLPDLASYRVAAVLRWQSRHAIPRLIAMTSGIGADDRNRPLADGFEQCLTLPVNRVALESVLRPRTGRLPPGRGSRSARTTQPVAVAHLTGL